MPRQKEFEREEVLEKALEVFWCNGYNGTSFADLTEGMCINRQSIYDTYGDKHTLFLEVLNHYSEKNGECIRAHFAQDKPAKQLFKEYLNSQREFLHLNFVSLLCKRINQLFIFIFITSQIAI